MKALFNRLRRLAAAPVPPEAPAPSGVDAHPNPAIRALAADWREKGYVVLPRFYSDAELDAAEEDRRRAWLERAPRIVVDDLERGQRLRLADVDDEARTRHRFKTNDLYLEHDDVRRLALNERLTPILTALLGHTPVLCNSLNFEQGSAQSDHVDALFMTPRSQHHLIAIWVALEDCHADAGPLRYYPGSHKITPYVFSTGSNHFVDAEMGAWQAYMDGEVALRGLQPETFCARKGDVFIWSAYLYHGGSPINDPQRTRKSIVFHYYSEADCIAHRSVIVPYAGGYWLHRQHQEVPGIGPSEAPPVPSNARNTSLEHQ